MRVYSAVCASLAAVIYVGVGVLAARDYVVPWWFHFLDALMIVGLALVPYHLLRER